MSWSGGVGRRAVQREGRLGDGARATGQSGNGTAETVGGITTRNAIGEQARGNGGNPPQRFELRVPAPHVSGLSPRAIGDPTAKASEVGNDKLNEHTLLDFTVTPSSGCAQS